MSALHPGAASAQTPPLYRVTKLVQLEAPGLPEPEYLHLGSIGLNNKGQVVYGYDPTPLDGDESDFRAWVWLPETDYGIAAGFHNLDSLLGSNPLNSPSVALDINESGRIAGQVGFISPSAGQAIMWELDDGGVVDPPQIFGTLEPDSDADWSRAIAINDDDPPMIVGDAAVMDTCTGLGTDIPFPRGFWLVASGANPALNELPPGSGATDSWARDVNNPVDAEDEADIAGYVDFSPSCPTPRPSCDPFRTAGLWEPVSSAYALDPRPDLGANHGAEARDMNDSGFSCGWGFLPPDTEPCIRRALAWVTKGDEYEITELGEMMPDGQESDQSWAEALRQTEPMQVVGWNEDQSNAIVWTRVDEVDFMGLDLTSTEAIGTCARPLFRAHDINDEGWIVGVGDGDEESETLQWVLLLTPIDPNECFGDVTGDTCINVSDVLALVAAWGVCDPGVICTADVTFDCRVNTSDLLVLNNNFGPCEGGSCPGSFAGPEEPPTLGEIIQIVLASDHDEATQAEIIQDLLKNY